ncbi:MAG: glycerate kinase, partial [Thermoleophilia bacterium]
GGTATVDGGAGLLEVVRELPSPTLVACDALVPLVDAARLFSAQKGASPEQARALEERLLAMEELRPYADLPGAGAAGGLGAALAFLGARLLPGADLVLDEIGFGPSGFDLVVTGEGQVDRTTWTGKAPGRVAARCAQAGVRCVVFGGRVLVELEGAETVALSGDPSRAAEDLVALGRRLAVSGRD